MLTVHVHQKHISMHNHGLSVTLDDTDTSTNREPRSVSGTDPDDREFTDQIFLGLVIWLARYD